MYVVEDTSETAALESFCLARLRRFAAGLVAVEESGVESWRRFTRRALLVAYHDCIALGQREEADEILEAALDDLPPSGRAMILLARVFGLDAIAPQTAAAS
jgi:DNA-directed RNA polymerase specialized sigma24 family protein